MAHDVQTRGFVRRVRPSRVCRTGFNGAAADQSDVSSHCVFWNTGGFAGLVKVLNADADKDAIHADGFFEPLIPLM